MTGEQGDGWGQHKVHTAVIFRPMRSFRDLIRFRTRVSLGIVSNCQNYVGYLVRQP